MYCFWAVIERTTLIDYLRSASLTNFPFFISSAPLMILFLAPGMASISAVSSREANSSSLTRTALGLPLIVMVTLSRFLLTFLTRSGRFALASEIEIKLSMFKMYKILYYLSTSHSLDGLNP